MSKGIKELLRAFKKLLLDEFGDQLSRVVLFGSYANGKATASSDIDVAVILDCDTDWHTRQKVYDLAFDAESDTGRLLNVTVFSKKEYETRPVETLLLIENILQQGVPV